MNEPARGHRLEAAGIRQFSHAFMTSTRDATVLAFDFGTRRIGVAVGNTLVRVAHPLSTIEGDANEMRFASIGALIAEWRPDHLVVGIPVQGRHLCYRWNGERSDAYFVYGQEDWTALTPR